MAGLGTAQRMLSASFEPEIREMKKEMSDPLECPRCHRRHTARAGSALTICPTCDRPPGLGRGPSEAQVRRYLHGRALPALPSLPLAGAAGIEAFRG